MVVPVVRGLDSQGIGEARGDYDPSLGMPPGKFKVEDVLGAEAPSHYEGMLSDETSSCLEIYPYCGKKSKLSTFEK
jgi:hypothetical protein